MSDLMLDVSQAHEIKMAARRADATNEDLKILSSGDMFARILPVLRGLGEVVIRVGLEFITTVPLKAQPRFVARMKFVVNTTDSAEVKIYFLRENFQRLFLSKIEEATEATEIAIHKLTQGSTDMNILGELGKKAEITLSEFWALLKAQGHGQAGPLLTNGYANIAYIRDDAGILWSVSADWYEDVDSWGIVANSVRHPAVWDADTQVISRK